MNDSDLTLLRTLLIGEIANSVGTFLTEDERRGLANSIIERIKKDGTLKQLLQKLFPVETFTVRGRYYMRRPEKDGRGINFAPSSDKFRPRHARYAPPFEFMVINFFQVKSALDIDYDGGKIKTHSLRNLFGTITAELEIRAGMETTEAAKKLSNLNFNEIVELDFKVADGQIIVLSEMFPVEIVRKWNFQGEVFNNYYEPLIFSFKH